MQQENYQKYFPDDFTLETPRVQLRLLKPEDVHALKILTKNADIWKYFTFDLSDDTALMNWIDEALAGRRAFNRMPFLIIDKDNNHICGSTSYGNISFYDKRIEIGWSWLGTKFRSTGINRHAKYCMMKYAFDTLDFERVEFKTDVQNARARKGLQNVGGIEEGILRSHMQMWNNRRRTSIYYSVLKDEWPGLKQTIFKEMELSFRVV